MPDAQRRADRLPLRADSSGTVGPWPTLHTGAAAPEHVVRDGALATGASARVCHVHRVRQAHMRPARRLRATPRHVYQKAVLVDRLLPRATVSIPGQDAPRPT
eukprot:10017697-Alexandrium_andersonii.AAC.1